MIRYWYEDGVERQLTQFSRIDFVDNLKLHRLNGPAYVNEDFLTEWRKHGMLHRTDGPALLYSTGEEFWYINDKNITDEVNRWIKENNLPNWTVWYNSIKILFKLTWC